MLADHLNDFLLCEIDAAALHDAVRPYRGDPAFRDGEVEAVLKATADGVSTRKLRTLAEAVRSYHDLPGPSKLGPDKRRRMRAAIAAQ